MEQNQQQTIEERERWVNGWNDTMINIWRERITLLGVIDTGHLLNSLQALPIRSDGRFYEIGLSESFAEYGLYQDLGVGKEVFRGNPGDIGRPKLRQRRQWFSIPYYRSVMALKEFLSESIGKEFVGVVTDCFTERELRKMY